MGPSLELNQLQAAKYEYFLDHICNWSVHPRPFSTIAIMQKGSGHFKLSNNDVKVNCGDAFFIPAGSKYISYWRSNSEVIYYAIHFHINNRFSDFSPQRFCLQKINTLSSDSFLPRFEKLCKYILADGFAKLKAYSLFYDMYADILPLLQYDNTQAFALNDVKTAVDYIEKHSHKEFKVGHLAKMCNISESRFYVLFQRTIGCSPIAYRNNVRIRKAATMLGDRYTIEEIATKVGFSSPIYFRRIFKEIMGKLPSEYRKNLRFSIEELS